MTYNLVYAAVSRIGAERNWTDAQIKQVASSMAETVGQADMSVDHQKAVLGADGKYHPEGGSTLGELIVDNAPFSCENSPHKMVLPDAMKLVEDSNDLTSFGKALHSLQDYFSHRAKPGLFYNSAFMVEINHKFFNNDIDNYAFKDIEVPGSDLGLSDDAKIDYMMNQMTQYFINQYFDGINWDLFEKYFLPVAEAEEKQE